MAHATYELAILLSLKDAASLDRLMPVSTGLGNNLQGSTADYVGILPPLPSRELAS